MWNIPAKRKLLHYKALILFLTTATDIIQDHRYMVASLVKHYSSFTSIFSGTVKRRVAIKAPAEAPAKAFTAFSNFLPCLQRAVAAPKW